MRLTVAYLIFIPFTYSYGQGTNCPDLFSDRSVFDAKDLIGISFRPRDNFVDLAINILGPKGPLQENVNLFLQRKLQKMFLNSGYKILTTKEYFLLDNSGFNDGDIIDRDPKTEVSGDKTFTATGREVRVSEKSIEGQYRPPRNALALTVDGGIEALPYDKGSNPRDGTKTSVLFNTQADVVALKVVALRPPLKVTAVKTDSKYSDQGFRPLLASHSGMERGILAIDAAGKIYLHVLGANKVMSEVKNLSVSLDGKKVDDMSKIPLNELIPSNLVITMFIGNGEDPSSNFFQSGLQINYTTNSGLIVSMEIF